MTRFAFIYPRFTGPYGGERHVLKLSSELCKMGHEVSIYTTSYNDDCDEIKGNDVIIKDINCYLTGSHNIATMMSYFWMGRVAADIILDIDKYDVVCGIGWQSVNALAFILEKSDNNNIWYYCLEPPRFIYDLSGDNNIGKKIAARMIKKSEMRAVKKLKNIIANGKFSRTQLRDIYNKNAEIVYPGVETGRFEDFNKDKEKKELGLEGKEIYLSVSKLHPRKRLDIAIDRFAHEARPNSIFVIIGDGPDRERLREKIKKQDKNLNIVMKSGLRDGEVDKYMKAADYFIFTARNEPFGLAPLEARLAGCKIVGEDVDQPVISWRESAEEFVKIITNDK